MQEGSKQAESFKLDSEIENTNQSEKELVVPPGFVSKGMSRIARRK